MTMKGLPVQTLLDGTLTLEVSGKIALFDRQDMPLVERATGVHLGGYRNSYVCFSGFGKSKRYAHRLVMNAPADMFVDHKNWDTLDNRRSNLRLATPSQSMHNTRKPRKDGGYRGVKFYAPRYRAKIVVQRKQIVLGWFKTAEDAALAYDEAAKRLHGEFAVLNFGSEQ